MPAKRTKARPYGEILTSAREYEAEHEWLKIDTDPEIIQHHDGRREHWVAAWVRIPDDE